MPESCGARYQDFAWKCVDGSAPVAGVLNEQAWAEVEELYEVWLVGVTLSVEWETDRAKLAPQCSGPAGVDAWSR